MFHSEPEVTLTAKSREKTNISLSLSSHIGIPSTVHVDNAIITAVGSRPSWLPPVLEHHLKIAYQGYQINHSLGHHEMTATGLLPNPISIIKVFDTSLRALETQIGGSWSFVSEIAFLKVQLQLYSFAVNAELSESKKVSEISLPTLEIMELANLSAIKLIEVAANLSEDVVLWSTNTHSAVAYAVCFLLKLSALPDRSCIDRVTARNSISQGWNLLRGGSVMENDHFSRICTIIEYLVKRNDTVQSDRLSMTVEARMSANIVLDAAWRAKDRFSESIKKSKPLDYTVAAEVESVLQFGEEFQFDTPFLEGAETGWDMLFQDIEFRQLGSEGSHPLASNTIQQQF